MVKACSKCGTENADEAKFCRSCGAELVAAAPADDETVAMRACRACGHLNRTSARFCSKCGADAIPARPSPDEVTVPGALLPPPSTIPTSSSTDAARPASGGVETTSRRPLGLWIALGAIVVALGAAGAWWLGDSRSPPPTFDSVPPPSALGDQAPAAPATVPPSAPIEAPVTPATSFAPPVAEPSASAPEAPATLTEASAPAPAPAPAARVANPAAKERVNDKATRDAKANALREQRAQAEAALARRRAEEARARTSQPAQPAATSVAATAQPAAPPPQTRTVQERCTGGNPLARGICESRECARAEHAGELVCQRIKAADDRRREQN